MEEQSIWSLFTGKTDGLFLLWQNSLPPKLTQNQISQERIFLITATSLLNKLKNRSENRRNRFLIPSLASHGRCLCRYVLFLFLAYSVIFSRSMIQMDYFDVYCSSRIKNQSRWFLVKWRFFKVGQWPVPPDPWRNPSEMFHSNCCNKHSRGFLTMNAG